MEQIVYFLIKSLQRSKVATRLEAIALRWLQLPEPMIVLTTVSGAAGVAYLQLWPGPGPM